MIYLKAYESNETVPKVGDYIYVNRVSKNWKKYIGIYYIFLYMILYLRLKSLALKINRKNPPIFNLVYI